MAVPKAENSPTICPDPDCLLTVFRQRPHAGVKEAIFFVIGLEVSTIELRETAVIANPQLSVITWQDGHGDVFLHPVCFSEHMNYAVLQSNQTIAVCSHPHSAVPTDGKAARIHP
jgi:hypothetical protein